MDVRDLRLRVRALFRRRQIERDLDDELAFHVEMETRKGRAAGLSAEAAAAQARARFGPRVRVAENCREARGIAFVDTLAQDVAYALRGFARAPVAAVTIVVTVALGLGLLAAIFTIFSLFVFRPEAVPDPDAVVGVALAPSGGSSGRIVFNRRQYEALRDENDVFSDVAARRLDITTRIEGRQMEGQAVTGNYFSMLGVGAGIGRSLTPDDDQAVSRSVIVLSHRSWDELFDRDAAIVGRVVLV